MMIIIIIIIGAPTTNVDVLDVSAGVYGDNDDDDNDNDFLE